MKPPHLRGGGFPNSRFSITVHRRTWEGIVVGIVVGSCDGGLVGIVVGRPCLFFFLGWHVCGYMPVR